MNFSLKPLLVLVLFFALINGSVAFAAYADKVAKENGLTIVTSIKPLQWLVQDVVGDTSANVKVLLEDGQNNYLKTLKPSQERKLASADIVFFIHNDFETFFVKNKQLSGVNYIPLGELPNLRLLSIRESGAMPHVVEEYPLAAVMENEKRDYHDSEVDWRIWLSPENAILMLKKITYVLSDANPEKAMTYKSNFLSTKQKILASVKTTADMLKPVLNKPFIVLHDGYQYFEEQYGLQSKATVLKHNASLSTEQVSNIKELIKEKNIQIIFKEEQFPDLSIKNLANDMTLVELDSFGQGKTSIATGYVDFMKLFSSELIFGLLSE